MRAFLILSVTILSLLPAHFAFADAQAEVGKCEAAERERERQCKEDDDLKKGRDDVQKLADKFTADKASGKGDIKKTCNDLSKAVEDSQKGLGEVSKQCKNAHKNCKEVCKQAFEKINGDLQLDDMSKNDYLGQLTQPRDSCERAGQDRENKIAADLASLGESKGLSDKCGNDVTGGGGGDGKKDENADGKGDDKKKEEEKKDGGGGGGGGQPQMPQMPSPSPSPSATPSDACSQNPQSTACLQLKENCTNLEFAQANPVCQCFNGTGDKSKCPTAAAKTTPTSGADSTTGGVSSSGSGSVPSSGTRNDQAGFRGSGGTSSGDGGGIRGSDGGAMGMQGGVNTPGLPMGDEHVPNTNVLGGKGGGSGGGAAGGGGGRGGHYSSDGNWIPPTLANRGAASGVPSMNGFRPKANDTGINATLSRDDPKSQVLWEPRTVLWNHIHNVYLPYINGLKK